MQPSHANSQTGKKNKEGIQVLEEICSQKSPNAPDYDTNDDIEEKKIPVFRTGCPPAECHIIFMAFT